MIPAVSERALVLAPRGRDGSVAAAMLLEAGINAFVCGAVPELVDGLRAGAGFAVITDEALHTPDLRDLSDWLAAQPPWSDFPFVLLTERGGGLERNPAARRFLDLLGNVTFVERPFHPTTLVSLAQSAVRARRRQYEARSRLEALHENERQLRILADSIPTLCWMAEADGHIFWYNQQWYDYTGTRPDDMEGWGWQSVHDPQTLPSVLERWGASLEVGAPFEMVFPLRAANGEYRPFLTRVQPVRNAEDEVVRWFGTNTDISFQQRSEEALRNLAADLEKRVTERTAELQASERRLRAMFETSFVFQCLLSPEGIVQDANAASLEGIQTNRDEVIGLPVWETAWLAGTPDIQDPARTRFAEVAGGATVRREIVVNLPTGRRTFDLSLRPMLGEAREVVAIVMEAMDITERRQAEEALRQSQKLEAIGQLTGGVAHDFNNLLMPILGTLDLLQRRYSGKVHDDRATALVDGALQSAERAKTLVQRLLGFARRQSLDQRAVDLSDLFDGLRELLRSSVGAGVELRFEIEPDLPMALADSNQLELALLNLCVNARDTMPEGGILTLDAAVRQVGDHAEVLGVSPGRYIGLSVSDTGAGMDAETLARAVEPFFSTKPTGQGTGLGLSMVHGLAAQLGGAFTLESVVGQGTRATLYLRVAEPAGQAAAPAARGSLAGGRPLSILLVDDEALVRSGTAEMLRELGHSVVEASGGPEALALVDDGLVVDLVITDYKMPAMSGADLAERLRMIRPGTPILLISGYTGVEREAPDLVRLTKPFRQADLAEALVNFAA